MTISERASPDLESALCELAKLLGPRLSLSDKSLLEASFDFGGFVARKPLAVARPTSDEEVAAVIAICHRHSIPLAVGGAGHSQHGQSLGLALKLDMRAMNQIAKVDLQSNTITVGGGAIWSEVVRQTYAVGRMPVILTNNVGTSVAGTLSMGGIGSASFKNGAQVDHVHSLRVVTGTGELCICSRDERPDLFDALRAGLGQCAVIVAATLGLRVFGPRISSFTVEYDEIGLAFSELDRLANISSISHLWMEYRPKKQDGVSLGIATLVVGIEHANDCRPDLVAEAPWLQGTITQTGQGAALWDEQGKTSHPFFSLRTRGASADLNPWIDVMVPADKATEIARAVFPAVTDLLELGVCAVTPIRVLEHGAPLLVGDLPKGALLLTFGLYFTFSPEAFAAGALDLMAALGSMLREVGRHYLSGYVPLDHEGWTQHYGKGWPSFAERKLRYDPRGILNGMFIAWS